jgi:hypothetical protein
MPAIPLQNTWPALTWGDLDNDGRKEIIWGPVNNLDSLTNPNPARIIVFESRGDGSDNMGVPNGFGGWLPNAKTSIISTTMTELRPCRFWVQDVDGDNKQEVVFNDRRASSANYHYGIMGVDNIPNNGGGTEIWTLKGTGKGDTLLTGTGNKWDLAILNNTIYLLNSDTKIFPVKNVAGTWKAFPPQVITGGPSYSFRGSMTLDINGDNTQEIVVGQWIVAGGDTACIYVLRQQGDTLAASKIASFRALGGFRLNGCAYGDIDGDNKVDMIFGTRYDVNQKPNNALYRLEYQGGDITNPASYTASIIDSLYLTTGDDIDILACANTDGDATKEVLYSSAYTRGSAQDSVMDIVILDQHFTPVGVKADHNLTPENFFVDQNYPNPFNPTTTIRFGLPREGVVTLEIFNVTGEKVKTVIGSDPLSAGTYTYDINAAQLPSGTYFYTLNAGDFSVTKKMILIK